MSFLLILTVACILDLLFGDPRWFPHPVRIIGWFAVKMEIFTRKLPFNERNSGRLTVLLVLIATGGVCAVLLALLAMLPMFVFLIGAAFILYTTIAARDLIRHAKQVYEGLDTDLETARRRVAMIVGRDTNQMDKPAIIRACVESVAENMSDGIIAPLFWATVGAVFGLCAGGLWPIGCGVTAAMLYKAINTMDSMFGYKNEQYLNFGSFPARLDDVVNFLPARISGLAIVIATQFYGNSIKNSWRILHRDCAKHTSPNAGWPEAAMAGALDLQLGGAAQYFGKVITKPTIGDGSKSPVAQHILLANRLVLSASLICLFFFICCYLVAQFFS